MIKYSDLILRHKKIFPLSLQKKIKKTKIFFVGCGLSSQVALLATRTGFSNFILIDGDKVEAHNLNRQSFRYKHLGQNKAQALASMIKDINPKAKVEFYPIFLKDKKLAIQLIDKSDIIINTADPDEMMYFVNDYSQQTAKTIFFPLNVFWGGYVLVFTLDSLTLKEMLGGKILKGNKFYLTLLEKTFSTFPSSLFSFYKKMGKKLLKESYFPQLGAATFLNASIIVSGIIKLLSGKKIKKAPQPIFLDLWEEV